MAEALWANCAQPTNTPSSIKGVWQHMHIVCAHISYQYTLYDIVIYHRRFLHDNAFTRTKGANEPGLLRDKAGCCRND